MFALNDGGFDAKIIYTYKYLYTYIYIIVFPADKTNKIERVPAKLPDSSSPFGN